MRKTVFLLGFIGFYVVGFSQTAVAVKTTVTNVKKNETKTIKSVQRFNSKDRLITVESVDVEIVALKKEMAKYTDAQILKEYEDKISSMNKSRKQLIENKKK